MYFILISDISFLDICDEVKIEMDIPDNIAEYEKS